MVNVWHDPEVVAATLTHGRNLVLERSLPEFDASVERLPAAVAYVGGRVCGMEGLRVVVAGLYDKRHSYSATARVVFPIVIEFDVNTLGVARWVGVGSKPNQKSPARILVRLDLETFWRDEPLYSCGVDGDDLRVRRIAVSAVVLTAAAEH